jgi:hypothetical protein
MRMVAHNPHVQRYEAGDVHWFGGVLVAINGATATIRYVPQLTAEINTSLLPSGIVKGHPIQVRATVSPTNVHTIVEVRRGFWDNTNPGGDESGAVDRALAGVGPWFYSSIGRDITGENEEKAWTRQLR